MSLFQLYMELFIGMDDARFAEVNFRMPKDIPVKWNMERQCWELRSAEQFYTWADQHKGIWDPSDLQRMELLVTAEMMGV